MRHKLFAMILAVMLIFSMLPTGAFAVDTSPADGYDDHDYDKIRAFLEQESADTGVKNGEKLNPAYNLDDPLTWIGVGWETSSPKRVISLSMNHKDVAGSLDISGCDALETVSCAGNKLTVIDANGCSALRGLKFNSNDLTS